jgi:hypothetical protein
MMGINAVWDDEDQTVLRLEFEGSWVWKDYDVAIEEAYRMLQSVSNPVDVMLNLSDSATVPPLKSLKSFQRTLSLKPANVRMFIAVGSDSFACGLCVSFLKALVATTLEQARAILASPPTSGFMESSAAA